MSCNPVSPKYPIVFVIGIAHSGSTLLGRLRDMHSRVLCVGELRRIAETIEKEYPVDFLNTRVVRMMSGLLGGRRKKIQKRCFHNSPA